MVEKDKQKFLDEIFFIGEQKEFKELFGVNINPLNLVKEADEILKTKRKAYNYAFCSCCEKYNIKNIDTIYSSFDKLWDDSILVDMGDLLKNILLFRGLVGAFKTFQRRTLTKWMDYIKKTREYANSLEGE